MIDFVGGRDRLVQRLRAGIRADSFREEGLVGLKGQNTNRSIITQVNKVAVV